MHLPHFEPITATAKRVQRPVNLSVPGDMAFYAALAGKVPEIDPTLANPMVKASVARKENPWSPAVLSIYLKEICRERAMKINKPELASWVRKQTEVARKRFAESQVRVIAARNRAA